MANPYYNVATNFLPNTRVKSDEVNVEYDAIEAGFDLLPGVGDAITRGVTYLGVESGSGNVYDVTMPDTRTAYAEGDRVAFRATHTNTGAISINIDAIGAITGVRPDDSAMEAGDLLVGVYYEFIYDSTQNHFQMFNQPASFLIDMDARVDWAEEWATKAEDSLISVDAGGDGSTDYSALHWAAKAAADAVLTAADLVATNADVTYAAEWAVKAEDSLISVAAGGDGATDYSALHWAAKAAASAATINLPDPIGSAGEFLQVNGTATGYENLDFRAEGVTWTANHTWLVPAGSVGNVYKPADASGDAAFNGMMTRHSDDTPRGFVGAIPGDSTSYVAMYTWDTTLGTPAWNRVFGATPDAKSIELSTSGATFEADVTVNDALTVTNEASVGGTGLTLTSAAQLKFATSAVGIIDQWDNELLDFTHIASAVNQFNIHNSATGNPIELHAEGTDSTIDMHLVPKGTYGHVVIDDLYFGTWDKVSSYTAIALESGATDNYLLLSSGNHTHVGSPSATGNIYLRPGLNDQDNELELNGTTGDLTHRGDPVVVRKNVIINSHFRFWQRHAGRAVAGPTNGLWTADRFQYLKTGSLVNYTVYSTAHPTITNGGSMYFSPTTADATLGSTDLDAFQYRVEGHDYRLLHKQECCLSFWVYTNVAGTYSVSFTPQGAPPGYSLVEDYYVPGSTWTFISIPFTPGTVGTWHSDEGQEGLRIRWALRCGSSMQTSTVGSWVAGNYRASTSMTNNWGQSTSHIYYIASPKLELGSYPTPHEPENFTEEMQRCQRYYEKSYDWNAAPGTATSTGSVRWYVTGGLSSATSTVVNTVEYKTSKYSSGTVTTYSPTTGTSGKWRDNATTSADVNSTLANASKDSFQSYATQSGAKTTIDFIYHWAVDAEVT